ncbi:hypothetical protein NLJ89_g669 [Agrocybe chaxingu]|uniref:Uncharacterized protein n=1 Tax=Agrocybe chaxingu TaxID=84603 RepID=A0A9W8N1C9_9AGAR|nr:hypothetical protein NLJ89_g669 [Agrocybe chaxingu]
MAAFTPRQTSKVLGGKNTQVFLQTFADRVLVVIGIDTAHQHPHRYPLSECLQQPWTVRYAPIYEALDTGSNKSAIVACNKLLKKHPQNELIKSLKALALIRSQKVEESLVLCDEVLELKPTNDAVLTAMMHVLRGLGRHNDMVTMFEEAYKKQPTNEELGAQTFFANVRASHWKSAHQIATRMYKQFQEDRYLYWSVISAILQARDISTPSNMRVILFKLAHRLITSSPTPSYVNADRFHLHLSILRELELYDEAEKLLDSDVGKSICATNLSCNEIRRDIWKRQGRVQHAGELAEQLILENKGRNWLEFLAVIDATLPSQPFEVGSSASEEKIKHAEELFTKVAEIDGLKDRSGFLALIELEKRSRIHGLSKGDSLLPVYRSNQPFILKTDSTHLLKLLKEYFEKFSDKACCFEDLKPYIILEDGLDELSSFLEAVPTSFTTVSELRRLINAFKFRRYSLSSSQVSAETELQRVAEYTRYYFEGLPLGAGLASTELQPADDLMLLAGNALVNLWKLTGNNDHLFNAVYLLEFALTKSKQSFLTRLILIRIYRLLGAPSLALDHYRAMQIKQVQHDTLSHLILSRSSTFSLASTGDLTLATECLESTQIYLSNSQETGDYIVRAFTSEKYSQIPEFLVFEDWLDNSLQRDIVKMEHLRMRLTHEQIVSDVIDMELIELKFIFDRTHYDNRDFQILPNYQPLASPGLNEQTLLFGKKEGNGWLTTFLKAYIRALQQASDLDDTVEEKLLIGDRPKQTADFDKKLSLRERLAQDSPEDLQELTPDEVRFVEFATALADWLEPYHNHARPPPAVVLAEAAKQTELKTGHPLKGVEIPPLPLNGNGHHKKDEEPPAVQEPPQAVVTYFEGLTTRLEEARTHSLPVEFLHVSTLAQEAFLLLVMETLRFKSSSVVKANKLGALVTSFKELKTAAVSVLKDVAASLIQRGELEGSAESWKGPVEACTGALVPRLDHDFLVLHSKKIAEARRKVLDGVAKGITRLYESNYYGGGGGYLQGGSPFSQSGSPGGVRRTEISNSLRPFTIAQLNKATQAHTDAEWRVDDVEVGQVTVVAQVVTINRQATNCVYLIDDGTGQIEARHWVDSNEDEGSKWGGIQEHRYVRVTGGLKAFGKKRYINTIHIRDVKDPHEIYFHTLETITVSLIHERGPPNQNVQSKAEGSGTSMNAYSAKAASGGLSDQFAHLPPLQRAILKFIIDQPPRDEGIHVALIAKAIGASLEDANKIGHVALCSLRLL